ncbi:MAG: hypothetical protein II226_03910 [Alistipes sp.]|nr:hypothetical protein [Alistipes sp.]
MKKLLFLLLCTFSVNVMFAQNASQFNILWGPLNVDVQYDSAMNPISHSFTLIFQDSNYDVLDQRFIYASGSAQDIFDSLKFIEDFAIKFNKTGMKMDYNGIHLLRIKIGTINGVVVDLGDKKFEITVSGISKIKKTLVKYCQTHKLEIPQ